MIGIEYWVVRPRPWQGTGALSLRSSFERQYLRVTGVLGWYPVLSETSERKVKQNELKWRISQRLQCPPNRLRLP